MPISLPFLPLPVTHAPFPVWSGSTTSPARFVAMPKKAAVRLWHRARDFDRGTHQSGRHGGAVGPTALQVLHALIFDFLNHRTGRLDPSYAAIAHKAGVCVRTVATALARLRELGILNWVRRCAESWREGRFVLEQETNAYAVLPDSQWRGGYRPPQEPPAPASGTWGEAAPMPDAVTLATLEGDMMGKVLALASDPKDRLARALASLGRAFMARDS
jgi:Helix-turn-helix domain